MNTLTQKPIEGELLPCPFCGGTNIDRAEWSGSDGKSGPGCGDCGALADSVEHWNRRTAPAVPAPNVDWLGLALALEAQARRTKSKTAERAMFAAANGLRLMGAGVQSEWQNGYTAGYHTGLLDGRAEFTNPVATSPEERAAPGESKYCPKCKVDVYFGCTSPDCGFDSVAAPAPATQHGLSKAHISGLLVHARAARDRLQARSVASEAAMSSYLAVARFVAECEVLT